ncbi:hypothetical protein O7627_20715 [Solwaraspora sp. WMMD1047]|uniref:hypothetical protein n=1 Tax=Solwaraspora sp. WMMD1047 TaxID=3016102 RepID=UPI0024160C35|nr:hypothetical protein [Solwaraspora sp. WMMD1047]MDG4831706.1 hypothetical protein [Solwaraspora sp. WMMD1047]
MEQQYAHVLWLIHGLHRQSPMTLLLRSGAAVYALAAPEVEPVVLGGRAWGVFPDYRAALTRLRSDGGEIFVSESSLDALGLTGNPLLPDIAVVPDNQIADLVVRSDRIWFL